MCTTRVAASIPDAYAFGVGHARFNRVARCLGVARQLLAVALVIAAVYVLWASPADPPLLLRQIDLVDFRGVPLEDALERLGNAVGAKVVIDRKALTDAGLKLSTPIHLHLHDVQLGAAFDQLNLNCAELCAMEPRGKELYVTAAAAVPAVIRIYDVSDICDRWIATRAWSRDPRAEIPSPPPTEEELIDQFSQLIGETVRLDDPLGVAAQAGVGSGDECIDSMGRRMVVYSRPFRQRLVEQLLTRLRKADAEHPPLRFPAPPVK